ncbi:MAG: MFS transporter [Gammaproteobacteria bacterium]|nr:MFS transporter [Gammaproteobacteria bacterium]
MTSAAEAPEGADENVEAKLPLRVKLSYGAPSFAGAAMAIPIGIHLTIFYSDTILVPLGFIALVKALARALDAITDPLMGWMSDRTKSRWGRRRPWIALGAPLSGLAFYLMFTPPEGYGTIDAATWFAATYVLYYIFHTAYIIPHNGLGPELTLDYHERSTLFGIREGFVVFGTLVAAVLPLVLTNLLGGVRAGYSGFAALFGALLALLYLNLVAQVRERPDFAARKSNPLVPGLRRVMRNRAFRILLAVYLTGSITGAIPGLMMPYFTKYVLQPDDPNLWLAIFLAVYFGAGFIFLPVWVWAARKFEKKPVWLVSFVPGFTASLTLFFMDKGDLIPTLFVLAWAGAAFGAGLFLGPAMQADVIDYDELYTGKRREAQYGALWSIMTKFMIIPSMSVPLAILASAGYMPNIEQTETVQFTISAIFGLAPAITAVAAFVLACFYPISRKIHEQIWVGIRQHERGETAVDPISGKPIQPPDQRGVDEETGWYLDHFSGSELNRLMRRGAGAVTAGMWGWAVFSGAVLIASTFGVMAEVDLETAPGMLAVFYVVTGGIGLTGLVYHIIRLRAARRLVDVGADVIESHLAVNRALAGG